MTIAPPASTVNTNVPPQNYGGVPPKQEQVGGFNEALNRSSTSNDASNTQSSKGTDQSQGTSNSYQLPLATRPPINLGNPTGKQGVPLYDGNGSKAGSETKAPSQAKAPTAAPSNATQLVTHTDAQLRELAKWPAQAHAEWNKLTQLERIAVKENMSKLYGEDFAKKFLEFTKSGSRQDSAYHGPHFPEHTPQWFADRGFKLARRDSVNDWWVHPSGFSITANRNTSPWKPGTYAPKDPPQTCEPGDSTELMNMTVESIKQNLSENADRQKEATELKEKMDKMNVTSPEFKKAYDNYGAMLDEGKNRVEAQIAELEADEEALKAMCASTSNIETAKSDLEEQLTWFEVTRGLHDMDIRKPISVDFKN
jgi:hypothetical protein